MKISSELLNYPIPIRTGYQGKNFEMLQTAMRKKPVQSIEEMIERNYTFYVQKGFFKLHKDMDLVQR